MSLILVVSILLSLAGMAWSVVLLRRSGDWRMGLFTLFFGLMALRQVLTLSAPYTSLIPTFDGTLTELPGLFVSVLALLMLRYVDRLLAHHGQAAFAPERLIPLIENSTDFIGLATLTGRVTYVNPAGLRLVGLDDLDAVRHKRTEDFVLEEDRQELLRKIQPALMKNGVWRGEYRFQHFKGGPPILFEINSFLVHDPATRLPVAIAIVNRDITERRQIEEERERLIADLETKNAELERFTYTVSHDLKTPLVTIKGFLGLLREDLGAGDERQVERNVAQIDAAADKMGRLLNELLELSRIGRLMTPPEPIDLDGLAREAVDLVDGAIAARGVAVEIKPTMLTVQGDRVRLLEVYQNLIENAVKFMGDQAEPRIHIGAQRRDGEVTCYVRDNGIGIPAPYHEKVFGLFERLDATSDGTGIGLALTKRIVEFHGGRAWVESDGPGRGATFYFTLPVTTPGFEPIPETNGDRL